MRPANIVTSVADVLAGAAIAGVLTTDLMLDAHLPSVAFLCFSTACLYGSGVVFNDVFDAELDKVERPERAIPSGMISIVQASVLGTVLLCAGIASAAACGFIPAIVAIAITVFALQYNRLTKHHPFFGPFNMGVCRGLNLLLGISVSAGALNQWYLLIIVPIVYIFSITMISRGEVNGAKIKNLYIAAGLYGIVAVVLAYFAFSHTRLTESAIFLLAFLWMIYAPLIKAIKDPAAKNIGPAVKGGVIALIMMDAVWAATFSTMYVAIAIACLLPLSLWLSKIFAVT
ncbi:polyprenyltransferase [Mucilaginibacter hurinus]|uniref:Polyprenyltransferase n=2 Tax=Mucilaginibacter hurinus TaxID=2201324 RepID=A0A367GKA8_9SPHI|nr:polyprenyltransferase [Mucilaginibacter hurinus]